MGLQQPRPHPLQPQRLHPLQLQRLNKRRHQRLLRRQPQRQWLLQLQLAAMAMVDASWLALEPRSWPNNWVCNLMVCAVAAPTAASSPLMLNGQLDALLQLLGQSPLAACLPSKPPHPLWLHSGADLCFVPSAAFERAAKSRGLAQSQLRLRLQLLLRQLQLQLLAMVGASLRRHDRPALYHLRLTDPDQGCHRLVRCRRQPASHQVHHHRRELVCFQQRRRP